MTERTLTIRYHASTAALGRVAAYIRAFGNACIEVARHQGRKTRAPTQDDPTPQSSPRSMPNSYCRDVDALYKEILGSDDIDVVKVGAAVLWRQLREKLQLRAVAE